MMNLIERGADKLLVFMICAAIGAVIGVIAWIVDLLEERYRRYEDEKKRRNNRSTKYDGWRLSNRERSIDKSNQRRQKGKKGET